MRNQGSASPAGKWRLCHLLLIGVQLVGLYAVGHSTPFEWGFPLDDAWIHQVVARTFAETGTLGYAPDRFGSAATSLLWATILAVNHAWLGMEPALFAFLVNALLALVAAQLWLALLRVDGFSPTTAFGIAAFAASAGNFIWFSFSGMEAMLVVFLSTAAIWFWVSAHDRDWTSALGSGICAALLFFTRPEAAAIAGVLTLVGLARGRRTRDLAILWGVLLAGVTIYFAASYMATGVLGPSTLEGRRIMWFQDSPTAGAWERLQVFLLAWADRLSEFSLAIPGSALFWIVLGSGVGGLACLGRRRAWGFGSIALWALAHLAVYAILLPIPGHGGRYQPFVPPIFLGCGWLGLVVAIDGVGAQLSARRRQVLKLVVALALAYPVLSSWRVMERGHHRAVDHVRATEIQMGRTVAALPRDARIATFDIGGIGYFADRPLIDLGALVDPVLSYALRDADAWRAIAELEIDYIVVPETYDRRFPDPWNFYLRLGLDRGPAGRLQELSRLESSLEVWRPGQSATWHCAPAQTLFEVVEP